MLKPLLPRWRFWPALCLAMLIAAAIYGETLSSPTQRGDNKAANVTYQDGPLTNFWHWITKDSISFFTFVLAIVGGSQGFLIWKQISLGRQEFIASHRPLMKVRYVRFVSEATNAKPVISFAVSNIGTSVAYMTKCAAQVELLSGALPAPSFGAAEEVGTPRAFKVGESTEYLATGNFLFTEIGEISHQPGYDPEEPVKTVRSQMFISGYIEYRTSEADITRTTAFCRKYNLSTNRFIPVDDPDWEYED